MTVPTLVLSSSASARFKEPQARHLTLNPGVGWDAACRMIFSRLSAPELRQAQTVRPSSRAAGHRHVLRRRPCFWQAGTPLPAESERSAQSFQRFLKRPAASSVYRTVFEMFLWPRYACKVRVSVPWLARA